MRSGFHLWVLFLVCIVASFIMGFDSQSDREWERIEQCVAREVPLDECDRR
jgi:hypothetical protein